ncbi:hypothetical protein B0J11DRAFT_334002 [Dendryphion nanum]|uniref:Rhodopsin domain-containing protein n=1 Tax=Dendryphion nanum TaxID=256645 RepID=A0A9P9DN55_9PLEO|nr:hypothetical protein B0J11DRAFT_334002 [Dendryphion nanum]
MIRTPQQIGQLVICSFSFLTATVGIYGRLHARYRVGTKWQANDYFMILAYLSVVGLIIAASLAVTLGEMGTHIPKTPLRQQELMGLNLKMTLVIPPLLLTSSCLVKMSITHFYIVLFPYTLLSRICRIQLVLLTMFWISAIIPCFFMCQPLAYTWNRKPPGGRCFDVKKFWLWTSVVALFFDLSCVVLPMPILWRLKTSPIKKFKLIILFGLGLFICVISIFRIIYDEAINFKDLPWTAAPAVMFAVLESALGILAGCLPVIVPLFKRSRARARDSFIACRGTGYYSDPGGSEARFSDSLPTKEHVLVQSPIRPPPIKVINMARDRRPLIDFQLSRYGRLSPLKEVVFAHNSTDWEPRTPVTSFSHCAPQLPLLPFQIETKEGRFR